MRVTLGRLSALVAGVALVMSCDGGPVGTKFGNGIAGGSSGTAPIVPPAAGSIDTVVPFVRIDTPVASPVQLINAGDSILVVTRIIDDRKVGTLQLRGVQFKGSASLGTLTEVERYPSIVTPNSSQPAFRAGLQDTIIRRYLKAAQPVDTSVDSLVIQAIHRDSAGNVDTTRRTVLLVNGPKVTITAPIANDSVPRGVLFSVSVTADHPAGIDSIEIHVQGDASTFPAPVFDTIVNFDFPGGVTSATLTRQIQVPANAPPRGRMTINARARDNNRNQGNAPPIVIFARAAQSVAPRVLQTVPAKLEYADSITVTATADGVAKIGRQILDSTGTTILNTVEVTYASPYSANQTVRLPLNLGLNDQGRRVQIRSYAIDTTGAPTGPDTGWSQGPGAIAPITNIALAWKDTSLITYGLTYALPRVGVAGDLAVDEIRGNVFVSNTAYNLLEIWNNTGKTFAPSGVQVGSQPWGMFISQFGANRDTLLVANSGSTTISKVDMAAATPTEALSKRIRTRNIVNFDVFFSTDANLRTTITWDGAINSFSDRPQYVAQSAGGRIFYSTKPTAAKTPGTIRWLDPALPLPDPRQIWNYGRTSSTVTADYILLNLDSIALKKASVTLVPNAVDTLVVCDHPYGAVGGDFCVPATQVDSVLIKARALGSDVEAVLGLDLLTLSLTDTNFVAASGDRTWVAFGEGDAAKYTGTLVNPGTVTPRIMMVQDTAGGTLPGFFSHAIQVDDIQENASEKVFGLALDTLGLQLLAHGDKSYVASVDLPFHLRLDGIYDSFDDGAGVAFHPRAKGTNTASSSDRVGFTATRSGVIEAFDVAHYNNRGKFVTKGNLYGPLRVTPPLPGDPAGVILKLYGLTNVGLIVIDLQAADIKP
jgi:hypothetical protein